MKFSINQKSGLGNQLFQYAAGLFFAQKYAAQLEIVLDPPHLANSHGYPRPFLLPNFSIATPFRERTATDRLLCSEKPRTLALTKLARLATSTQVYREPIGTQWLFNPTLPIAKSTRHLYLEGYWQSYPYAAAVEPELRRTLVFRDLPTGPNLEVLNQVNALASPVSLHIRRGDYTLAAEGNHALPMSYYVNAIAAVRAHTPDATFVVFSDDIPFARTNLPTIPAIFVDHNDDHTAHEDLRLMSSCRHHIIANSSFSWWGAWLNPNPEKVVYAPNRWLDPTLPTADLIPPDWQRIPAQ